MQNYLTIIKATPLTTVQDLGRENALHLGFSTSGAADERAFLAGNQALNNTANCAALEICYGQLTVQAEQPCTIIVTGAICPATINQQAVNHWQILQLQAGDILVLGSPNIGVYSYLCVVGGIQSNQFLASRSTLKNSLINLPNNNKTLMLSDHCYSAIKAINAEQRQLAMRYIANHNEILTLRFIAHPQWQNLNLMVQNSITNACYKISPQSDKMGYRFIGPKINLTTKKITLSKPVCYGTIQLPSDGQPIILMKDHQTIGGYPTLGTVIKIDLFTLAQQRPGQKIKLSPISLTQAQTQWLSFQKKFN